VIRKTCPSAEGTIPKSLLNYGPHIPLTPGFDAQAITAGYASAAAIACPGFSAARPAFGVIIDLLALAKLTADPLHRSDAHSKR
jgi:hypothetical protein